MKFAPAILLCLPLLSQAKYFNRISNFFVCDQTGGSCEDDDFETVAEVSVWSQYRFR